MTKQHDFSPAELVGIACHIGAQQALEFVEFGRSLDELDEQQRKLLLRGWLAMEAMPKDAALERADLLRVMTALRKEWLRNARSV